MVTDRPQISDAVRPSVGRSLAGLYANRTMLVLLGLGFSGGLPFVIVTSVASAWTSAVSWSVTAIAALTFCTLPYALKFLWAPFVDSISLPLLGKLGRRRGWLLLSQSLAFIALVALCAWGATAAEPPSGHGWSAQQAQSAEFHNRIFFALICVAAFFSATQDIVADAYRAEILSPQELGAGASAFVTGYRMAFVVLGAGVLILADRVGWTIAALLATLGMAVGIVSTLCAREPIAARHRPGIGESIVQPFVQFWSEWGLRIVALMAFVLLFKLPDQLVNAITTPLLMKGLGYTPESIGWVRQAFGFSMTIVGAVAGGWMVARWGVMRCLWIFGIAHCVSIAGFLVLVIAYGASVHVVPETAPPIIALMVPIGIENLVIGMVTSGFVAFLMGICDHRYTATQYALLTALMALGNTIAGGLSGVLADKFDYQYFLIFAMLAGIPGVMLIPFIRPPNLATPMRV